MERQDNLKQRVGDVAGKWLIDRDIVKTDWDILTNRFCVSVWLFVTCWARVLLTIQLSAIITVIADNVIYGIKRKDECYSVTSLSRMTRIKL